MAHLTKQQIEYIRENLSKKSRNQLARDLHIDKRELLRHLKTLEKTPAAQAGTRRENPFSAIASLCSKVSPKTWTAIHVAVIFFAAIAVRLLYIHQLKDTYFFAPFKGGYDDYIFDNWAREILKGNWLGDGVLYIYRMPLYGYALALLYFIFGHHYLPVYIVQALVGAGTCLVIYAIGAVLANRAVGFIAGLFNALYGVFLYYTGMLVGETLSMFVGTLAILFLALFQKYKKSTPVFFAGLSIGIAALARANMLIVAPFILVWICVLSRKDALARLVRHCAAFILGVVIALAPVIIRNYVHEKDIVPVIASGGINFYIGNAYGADGKYRITDGVSTNPERMIYSSIEIAEKKAGRELKPSEISAFWVNETFRSMKERGVSFLFPLMARKFALFWNSFEVPDIWDYYFFKKYIPVLRMPLFSFSVIAPLAFVGLYLAWPKRKELSLLYIMALGQMLSLVAFFVTSRYRTQAVPVLSIFAAYGLAGMVPAFSKDRLRAVVSVFILIGAVLFSNIQLERSTFETSHNSLGILLKRDGKIDDAIREYRKAIDIAPRYPSPYYNLGLLYRDTGQPDKAIYYFNKTLEIDPGFAPARQKLDGLLGKR
ncbi:MAG: tetratricopeptide repeat protein [Candidatus Omnitrophica bacterium]|nr:tetratricopeptide repeat protein [Candidatus Omnitrophota bacterium]